MEFARDDFGISLRGVGEIPTPLVDGCVDEFRVVLHEARIPQIETKSGCSQRRVEPTKQGV